METRRAASEIDSPILRAERARLLARLGDDDAARSVLAQLKSLRADPARAAAGSDTASGDSPVHQGLATRCASACLVLADIEGAERWLVTAPSDEESLLCRAAIAVARGRLGEARNILRSSFDELPGGASRARALRLLLDAREAPDSEPRRTASLDPSDAIDHPHLFRRALFLGRPADPAASTAPLPAGLRSIPGILARRDRIVHSMRDRADGDVITSFEALHSLYVEVNARRKARETAWYLVHLDPSSAASSLRLAQTYSAAEHIMVRLSALQNTLRLAPGHPDASRLLQDERGHLGLSPSRQE